MRVQLENKQFEIIRTILIFSNKKSPISHKLLVQKAKHMEEIYSDNRQVMFREAGKEMVKEIYKTVLQIYLFLKENRKTLLQLKLTIQVKSKYLMFKISRLIFIKT